MCQSSIQKPPLSSNKVCSLLSYLILSSQKNTLYTSLSSPVQEHSVKEIIQNFYMHTNGLEIASMNVSLIMIV